MGSVSVSSCKCCVLCASSNSSQCRAMHDLQFGNAGRGCKRRPYGQYGTIVYTSIIMR